MRLLHPVVQHCALAMVDHNTIYTSSVFCFPSGEGFGLSIVFQVTFLARSSYEGIYHGFYLNNLKGREPEWSNYNPHVEDGKLPETPKINYYLKHKLVFTNCENVHILFVG